MTGRTGSFAVALILAGGALVASACSGSSSESPWPVEPSSIEPGPEGEQPKQGIDPRKLENRYGNQQDDYGASGGGRPERRKPAQPSLEESGAVP
jgi:hypothetical protein